jgi:uncharacterized protein
LKSKSKKLIEHLKTIDHRKLDSLFHNAHDEVFSGFDCLSCANCCKSIPPLIREADIRRISSYLRIKPSIFTEKYIRIDEDGDYVFNTSPCPFLDSDNYCIIYNHRPLACAEYPHTNRARMHQLLDLTTKNEKVCPAVQQILKNINLQI